MSTVFTVTAKGIRWSIARNGQALSSHASRDTAVMKARRYAMKHVPSKLVVYSMDKTQEFEWHYG